MSTKPLEVGVFSSSLAIPDLVEALRKAKEIGINVVQIGPLPEEWYGSEGVRKIEETTGELGVELSAVCVAYKGEDYSDMESVRGTVGLTNPDLLPERMEHTKRVVDFAQALGIDKITLHIGVIPKERGSLEYKRLLDVAKEIADYCGDRKIIFALETGQETGEEQREFIERTKRENVKVNFDPANMILYGTGRPVQTIEVLGPYIVHTHAKDGKWPTEEGKLGEEVPLGEGEVDIPAYVKALYDAGYRGPLVIEREAGVDRIGDILRGKELLEKIVSEILGG